MSGQPLQRLVLEERLRGSSLTVVNYLLLCHHLHGPYYIEVTSGLQVSWGGELHPQGPTPYFWTEKVPFIYLLLTNNGTPFTLSYIFASRLKRCKCTGLKIWKNHKTRMPYLLFHSQIMHLPALLGLFTSQNDRFHTPGVSISTDDRRSASPILLREVGYFSSWRKKQLVPPMS